MEGSEVTGEVTGILWLRLPVLYAKLSAEEKAAVEKAVTLVQAGKMTPPNVAKLDAVLTEIANS